MMPLAFRAPAIVLSEPPVTLLSIVAFEYGWKKLTDSFRPMLKELKLTTARSSAVMFKVEASGAENEALPDSTDQPSGRAKRVPQDITIDNIYTIKKAKFFINIFFRFVILVHQ
jgi:hypothetical protein